MRRGFGHQLVHFVREAGHGLWSRKAVTALTVAGMTVALVVLAGFLLAAEAANRILVAWGERGQVSLFLVADADEDAVDELRAALVAESTVADVRYVSAAEARARFARQFRELADLADEIETNPFPASLEVTLRPQDRHRAAASALVERYRHRPGVDDVQFDVEWLEGLERATRMLRLTGVVVGGVLLAAAVFSMANVVRLALLMRHDEIAILELVGATRGFVLGPFLVEAVVQGLAAAVLAVAAVELARRALLASAGPLGTLGQLLAGGPLSASGAALVLAAGVLAALAGTLLSFRTARER